MTIWLTLSTTLHANTLRLIVAGRPRPPPPSRRPTRSCPVNFSVPTASQTSDDIIIHFSSISIMCAPMKTTHPRCTIIIIISNKWGTISSWSRPHRWPTTLSFTTNATPRRHLLLLVLLLVDRWRISSNSSSSSSSTRGAWWVRWMASRRRPWSGCRATSCQQRRRRRRRRRSECVRRAARGAPPPPLPPPRRMLRSRACVASSRALCKWRSRATWASTRWARSWATASSSAICSIASVRPSSSLTFTCHRTQQHRP